jgi:hypothetical protein
MRLLAIILCVGTLAIAAFAGEQTILHIELRQPKSVDSDALTYVAFDTDKRIQFEALSYTKEREDGGFTISPHSYELLSGDKRRAIAVYVNRKPRNRPEQVFILSVPRKPKIMDWTDWQRPNYVETNAVSNFNDGYTPPDRSTNIPVGFYEIRYKIDVLKTP